jgi:hypothetical protein
MADDRGIRGLSRANLVQGRPISFGRMREDVVEKKLTELASEERGNLDLVRGHGGRESEGGGSRRG